MSNFLTTFDSRTIGRTLALALSCSPALAFGVTGYKAGVDHSTPGAVQHRTAYSPVMTSAPRVEPVMAVVRNHEGPVRLASLHLSHPGAEPTAFARPHVSSPSRWDRSPIIPRAGSRVLASHALSARSHFGAPAASHPMLGRPAPHEAPRPFPLIHVKT